MLYCTYQLYFWEVTMAVWTFEEDFLVCEFYFEHLDGGWRPHIDELMNRLKSRGYINRERSSAIMRVQNYEYLHRKTKGLSKAAKQSIYMYDAYSKMHKNARVSRTYNKRINNMAASVNSGFITGICDPEISVSPISSSYLSSTAHIVYNQIFGEGTEVSFKDVLFKFIELGGFVKDSDVYNACQVGRDTFSAIRCGTNKGVSKRTALQLCFGLKLKIDEAVILLTSAGFGFSDTDDRDKLVVDYLKRGNHDIFEANIELYDKGADLLF